MKPNSNKIYCAFCKLPRNFYNKKHIHWTNVGLSALCAFLTMFIIWQSFEPVVLVFFVIYLALAEIFIQIRWRLSVVCPHCSFDPVIYVKNPELACQKVIQRLNFRKESGDFLLSANDPFRNLPKRKMPKQNERVGLSKHI